MAERALVLFGAESDAGLRVAERAVDAGRRVIAVARRRPRDTQRWDRLGLDFVLCDTTRRQDVDRLFAGLDERHFDIVCLLGGTPQLNSQGNINVIDAAEFAGIERFVLTTSIGCGDSAVVLDPFVKVFAGKSIRAKDWAENRLRETTLEWTIVRSGGLTQRPARLGPVLVENPYVVGYINRSDLGDAVYAALSGRRVLRRTFAAVDRGRAMDIRGHALVPADVRPRPKAG